MGMPAVYITFESPNSSELEGMANDAGMAAIAQIAGGELSPEQMQELLGDLQQYVENGLMPADILDVLQNLNHIQALDPVENAALIQSLSQNIVDDLKAMLQNSDISPAILAETIKSFEDIVADNPLADFPDIADLKQDVAKAALIENLQSLAGGMDPAVDAASIAEIEALIEKMDNLEGAELGDALDDLKTEIAALSLPEELAGQHAAILSDIDSLKAQIETPVGAENSIDINMLAGMAAEDIASLLIEMDGMEDLPPEIQELLDRLEAAGIDVANMEPAQIADALAGHGDPALSAIMNDMVAALGNPEVQAALPPRLAEQVAGFVQDNPSLVAQAGIQSAVEKMNTAMESGDLTAKQIEALQTTIERLEAGDDLGGIDPAALKTIAESLPPENRASFEQAISNVALAPAGDPSPVGGGSNPDAGVAANDPTQIFTDTNSDVPTPANENSPVSSTVRMEVATPTSAGGGAAGIETSQGSGNPSISAENVEIQRKTETGPRENDQVGDLPSKDPSNPDRQPPANENPADSDLKKADPENKPPMPEDKPDLPNSDDRTEPVEDYAEPVNKEPPVQPDLNADGPEDGNPPANNPPQSGPEMEPETFTKPANPSDPCGDGPCNCFNKVAEVKVKDDQVTLTREDGQTETLTREEAKVKIAEEMTQGRGINESNWQKILDKNGGDDIKAREDALRQIKLDADSGIAVIERHQPLNIDTKAGDDAIRQARDAMLAAQMRRQGNSGFSAGGPSAKGPFDHVCNEGCDHGGSGNKNKNKLTGADAGPYKAKSLDEKMAKNANGNNENKNSGGFKGRTKQRTASPAPN